MHLRLGADDAHAAQEWSSLVLNWTPLLEQKQEVSVLEQTALPTCAAYAEWPYREYLGL